MIDETFMETLRLQYQTDLQDLLTFVVGPTTYKEATVVQEFVDKDEVYPCIVIDITNGNSPSRHVGRPSYDLISTDVYALTLRPNGPTQVVLCEDGNKRSGRMLAEYLGLKIGAYLKDYRPVAGIVEYANDMILSPDVGERPGVFKTVNHYEFTI